MGTGLPNVVVTSLALSANGTELFAGTYGRSVFSIGIEAPPAACPADTNGDGTVDVTDLIEVVVAWGTSDPAADVTGDGVVDVTDLVEVILAWGPC